MEETRTPSLRTPTAPRRKDRLSSLRSAVPAARESMSSSERPFMDQSSRARVATLFEAQRQMMPAGMAAMVTQLKKASVVNSMIDSAQPPMKSQSEMTPVHTGNATVAKRNRVRRGKKMARPRHPMKIHPEPVRSANAYARIQPSMVCFPCEG